MKYTVVPNVAVIIDNNVTTSDNMFNLNDGNPNMNTLVLKSTDNSSYGTVVSDSNNTLCNQMQINSGALIGFSFSKSTLNNGDILNWYPDLSGWEQTYNETFDSPVFLADTNGSYISNNRIEPDNVEDIPLIHPLQASDGFFVNNNSNSNGSSGNVDNKAWQKINNIEWINFKTFFNDPLPYDQWSVVQEGNNSFQVDLQNKDNAITSVADLSIQQFLNDPLELLTQTAWILLKDSAVDIEKATGQSGLVNFYYLCAVNGAPKPYKLILANTEIQNSNDLKIIAKWEKTLTSFVPGTRNSAFSGFSNKWLDDNYVTTNLGWPRKVKDSANNIKEVDLNVGKLFKHKVSDQVSKILEADSLPNIVLMEDDGVTINKIVYFNLLSELEGGDLTCNVPGLSSNVYNDRNLLSTGNGKPKIGVSKANFISMLKQIGYKQDSNDNNTSPFSLPVTPDNIANAMIGKMAYGTGNKKFFKPNVMYSFNALEQSTAFQRAANGTGVSHPHEGGSILAFLGLVGPVTGTIPAEDLMGFNFVVKSGASVYNSNTCQTANVRIYLTGPNDWTYSDLAKWNVSQRLVVNTSVVTGSVSASYNSTSSGINKDYRGAVKLLMSFCPVPSRSKVTIWADDGNVYRVENKTTGVDDINNSYVTSVIGQTGSGGAQPPASGDGGTNTSPDIPTVESNNNNYIKW